jgi:hypothetical protein
MTRLSCIVLACTILAGCTKEVRYRFFPDQQCEPQPDCVNLPARQSGAGWELGYIEFDDKGEAWDDLQTDKAVELIQQARRDNGAAVVLLYVHGWKNSANDAPPGKVKDVEKFKVALNAVATLVSRAKTDERLPPLVGIYVGWRGGTIGVEPLKTLTYWSRRAVARRVGRKGLFDSIGRIIDAAKPPSDDRSRVILVGHSFGARVLEHAVDGLDERGGREGRMLAWQNALPADKTAASPPPPVDLVVFVNAATQSSLSGKTIGRLLEKGTVFYPPGGSPEACADDPNGDRRPQCRPVPLYVALTSTGDSDTRFIMPVANAVIPPAPLPLRLRSAAFTSRLRSHDVVEQDCPPPVPYRCDPEDATEFCFEAFRDEERVCYQVQRKPNASNTTPFWAMTVDPRVVENHGDIWNQNLLALFSELLARTGAADVSAPRVMTRK